MMLHIGHCPDKTEAVTEELLRLGLSKAAIIGEPLKLPPKIEVRYVTWKESILYREYYPMLQFVAPDTLFVWNEAMHGTNRYCLEYNCIRRYAQQTKHRLIFQAIPVVESKEDALILADMASDNPFLKEPWEDADFGEFQIWEDYMPYIRVFRVRVDVCDREAYRMVKEKAIADVKRDPDIIPRRCLKFAEDLARKKVRMAFDSKARLMSTMKVSVTDLPVDGWYYDRLCMTIGGIEDVIEKVLGKDRS